MNFELTLTIPWIMTILFFSYALVIRLTNNVGNNWLKTSLSILVFMLALILSLIAHLMYN